MHTHIDEHGNVYTHSHDQDLHHDHTHAHGHTHTQTKNVLNRMAKIIGHMESIKTMIENGRDCTEVLIQLSAVKSAINGVSKVILKDHMDHCIVDAVEDQNAEALAELEKAIDMLLKS
ncbi:MAG: metal-sensing transcriptional repressor [Treponemataceae bacterium]|nr:metal-sensing transcriptional repressor [Treponemataceae bacterium]